MKADVLDLAAVRRKVATALEAECLDLWGCTPAEIGACRGDWVALRELRDRQARWCMGDPPKAA